MATYPLEALKDVTIGKLAWLSGVWRGRTGAGNDPIEEHWSEPMAGSMVGMFRLVQEGKVEFYELITIEEEPDALVLRIKHFYPDMKGWEEKDESVAFHLCALSEGEAVFFKRNSEKPTWIVYRRADPQHLLFYFDHEGVERKLEDDFLYTRV